MQEFRQLLQKHHITQCLSRPAQCWDNSVAEAWFGTYKLEMIEDRSWRSNAALRAETVLWIEGWSRPETPPFQPQVPQPCRVRAPALPQPNRY